MNLSDLRPACDFAKQYGVKAVIFGGPGSGKTPLINTAPRPLLLITEPGMLSMRSSQIPACEAYSMAAVDEFFKWFFESKETDGFDTLAIDSMSEVAELIVAEKMGQTTKNGLPAHGLKAHGEMAEKVMSQCRKLYLLRHKNVVLIAKQTLVENGRQTLLQNNQVVVEPVLQKRPYFPGVVLNVKVPHLFDMVMHLGDATVPGQTKPVRALRTNETPEIFSRDRSGLCDELERPDLTYLFTKILQKNL